MVPRKTQRYQRDENKRASSSVSQMRLPAGLDSPISLRTGSLPAAPRLSRRGRPGAGDLSRSLGEKRASREAECRTPRAHSAPRSTEDASSAHVTGTLGTS